MTVQRLITANRPAQRRIVLLAPDGTVERVLAEPVAAKVIDELRRLRAEYPGRSLAAEWQQRGKWIRWITTLEAKDEEAATT